MDAEVSVSASVTDGCSTCASALPLSRHRGRFLLLLPPLQTSGSASAATCRRPATPRFHSVASAVSSVPGADPVHLSDFNAVRRPRCIVGDTPRPRPAAAISPAALADLYAARAFQLHAIICTSLFVSYHISSSKMYRLFRRRCCGTPPCSAPALPPQAFHMPGFHRLLRARVSGMSASTKPVPLFPSTGAGSTTAACCTSAARERLQHSIPEHYQKTIIFSSLLISTFPLPDVCFTHGSPL